MSRAYVSCFVRSGNPNVADSNHDLDFKMYACQFLAWHSTLLGYDKDCSRTRASWLSVKSDSDIMSWCCGPNLPVRKHYKLALIAHCDNSVPDVPLAFARM